MADVSVFETLSAVNVNGRAEKKSYKTKTGKKVELTYLSWAWAWGEVKKRYPDAQYKIYETPEGCIYWTDGKTCWVKTGVTIEGQEHIEYLPVMDNFNNSILLSDVMSTHVNKAIQRSLTKAIARHGLGLYIYAGEDLPETEGEAATEPEKGPEPEQSHSLAAKQKAVVAVCIKHNTTPQKICEANGVPWAEDDEDLLDRLAVTFQQWGWT